MEIILDNLRQPEGIIEDITPLENLLEQKFNLAQQVDNNAAPSFPHIKVMRICLLVGLSLKGFEHHHPGSGQPRFGTLHPREGCF